MGASFSSSEDVSGSGSTTRPKLGDIPESCIALVLSRLNPPEICSLARLNRAFRGASSADFIWESKLPSNYQFIIDQVFVGDDLMQINPRFCECKKDIFACLSRPHFFDDGNKEVWLDKRTGDMCLAISSKAMSITCIDDRRHWTRLSTDESRFKTIAYLQQIWWLEVNGEVEFKFPAGTYTLFVRLQIGKPMKRLGRKICSLEHVQGWDIRPVRFQLSTSDGQCAESHHYLYKPGSWVLYRMGDFVVEDPNEMKKVKFSVNQIDCTHIKGGLCVDSLLIYPLSKAMEVVECRS